MTIHIFGGGTITPVRSHMALCAPAYGNTARMMFNVLGPEVATLHLTRMADHTSRMETNEDVANRLVEVVADVRSRAVVFNVALCDYYGEIGEVPSGKYAKRLSSREGDQVMRLKPAPKLLKLVKGARPDIKLVGFKTTADASVEVQLQLATRQIEETGTDVVFANDTVNRRNYLLFKQGGVLSGTREKLLASLLSYLKDA